MTIAALGTLYVYQATVVRVVDGDTVYLLVDCGFDTHRLIGCRLSRINAPERGKPGGSDATAALSMLCPTGSRVTIRSDHWDKWGRAMAEIVTDAGVNVSDAMLASNNAVPWDGTGKRP